MKLGSLNNVEVFKKVMGARFWKQKANRISNLVKEVCLNLSEVNE